MFCLLFVSCDRVLEVRVRGKGGGEGRGGTYEGVKMGDVVETAYVIVHGQFVIVNVVAWECVSFKS